MPLPSDFCIICSEDLARGLGAKPVALEHPPHLSFPVYHIPEDCIEVDIGDQPYVWIMVPDDVKPDAPFP